MGREGRNQAGSAAIRRSRSVRRLLAAGALATAFLSGASAPAAARPHERGVRPATKDHSGARAPDPPPRFGAPGATATRLAALTPAACLDELGRRGVPFRDAGPEPGVETPVRLLGPVGGVTYRTDFPDSRRATVPFEVFDCHLALALTELSPILRAHSIDEVRIYCAYRPPLAGAERGADGKPFHAHPAGLAVDVRLFRKSSGETLDVDSDFHGRLGAVTCGAGAEPARPPEADTPGARELREIYCAAAERELFHVQLSPNHDARHHNHFHLEVRPGVRWFIVR